MCTAFIKQDNSFKISGLLIVHPHLPHLPEHHLTIGDWDGFDGHTIQINDPASIDVEDRGSGQGFATGEDRDTCLDGSPETNLKWDSGLINGRGRYDLNVKYPLSSFRVAQGERYRFRMANVGSDFPLKVSIDGHMLRLVATDGYDVDPMLFNMVVINVGETIDFDMWANSTVDRYWLRANTEASGDTNHEIRAVVIYGPLEEGPDPISLPAACTETSHCIVYNCPFKLIPSSYNQTCVNVDQIKTTGDYNQIVEEFGLAETNVTEIFLNLGIEAYGASVNAKRFLNPSGPLFQSDTVVTDCAQACSDPSQGCFCTHILEVQYGTTVRLVVSGYQRNGKAFHHPFHVHGHHFAVVKVGYPIQNVTTGKNIAFNTDVVCDVENGPCIFPHWNGESPPAFNMSFVAIKDTVVVPAWGYVVLQFRAVNPGAWLMHCHMSTHEASGMAVLMLEAPDRIAPPPRGFPQCHNFEMSNEEFAAYRMFAEKRQNNPTNEYQFNTSNSEGPLVWRQSLVSQDTEADDQASSSAVSEEESASTSLERLSEEQEQSDDNEIGATYNGMLNEWFLWYLSLREITVISNQYH